MQLSKSILIKRTFANTKQSIGQLHVIEGDKAIFSCCTLELPNKDNKVRVSRIPRGNYKVVKRTSAKFKEHFHILDVTGRTYILIHSGNFHTQILGCVLVGSAFRDINVDGYTDVVSSKNTLNKLLEIMPDSFGLTIE